MLTNKLDENSKGHGKALKQGKNQRMPWGIQQQQKMGGLVMLELNAVCCSLLMKLADTQQI